jgi:membrane protease YdiL (CAAX protease family)
MSISIAGVSSTTLPSTVAAPSAPPVGAGIPMVELLMWCSWAVVGIGVAYVLGAFKPRSVLGPDRLSEQASGWDLLFVLCGAFLAENLAITLCFRFLHLSPSMNELVIGSIAKAASAAAILIGVSQLKVLGLDRMGLGIRRMGIGFIAGTVTLFVLFPLIELTSAAVVFTYRVFHLHQADLHPVLQIMGDNRGRRIRLMGVVLAVVIAPIAEELFFRGLLQTALGRMFGWFAIAARSAATKPSSSESTARSGSILNYFNASNMDVQAPRTTLTVWLSIVVTAAIFAVFHGQVAFLAPLFVLAVGLGYAYERTGNLWVNITTHALFNTAQILIYLTAR